MALSKRTNSARAFVHRKKVFLLAFLVFLAVWQSLFLITKTVPIENVEDDGAKARWLVNDPKSMSSMNTERSPPFRQLLPISKLIHVAKFGAGHRLCRSSTAYHLAKRLNLTRIKFQWNTCGASTSNGTPIFPYLFGGDVWDIEINTQNTTASRGKDVLVRNDVFGYVPGQALKNHFVPLPSQYRRQGGPFLEKLASDKEFYEILETKYNFRGTVLEFMQQHGFDNHFVIGVHLRAGNGEQAHFAESGRGIQNETKFVSNLVNSIGLFIKITRTLYPERFEARPPLIFLATDTGYLVDHFVAGTKGFGVSTILFPQLRLSKNEGVTFSALKEAGEKCLHGWQAMFNDMFLLSRVDILVASQKSTFTQSLPLSLLFHRTRNEVGPHFCEVSKSATSLNCYQDLETWLFRDVSQNIFAYSTAKPVELVSHKLVLLLPDIKPPKDFIDVENFIRNDRFSDTNTLMTHTYGSKPYFQKYRNKSDVSVASRFNIKDDTIAG